MRLELGIVVPRTEGGIRDINPEDPNDVREAKLRSNGMPLWVLAMYVQLPGGSWEKIQRQEVLTDEERDLAQAFYQRHKEIIDGKVQEALR